MPRKVNPVPRGFRTVTPQLVVRNAVAAIEFYKDVFGATVEVCQYTTDGVSVVHAELKVGNSVVMLCDEFAQWGSLGPMSLSGSPVSLHVYMKDIDAVWEKALANGAIEIMPLQNAYWGDRFGRLIDPFGHHWSLAQRIEQLSADEIAERSFGLTSPMSEGAAPVTAEPVIEYPVAA